PLSNQRRTPALPKCAWVLRVAHLRTPAHGLRQHGCGNTIGCALQETPDEGPANAETHHHELVDAQMIHQAELVVGVGIPRPTDLARAGGLAGEEGYGRVQSPAGKQHKWETGPGLLIVDANGAVFIEFTSSSFFHLLSKYARHGGRRRCRGARCPDGASGRTHNPR